MASARRAARLRCPFSPAVASHAVVAAYFDEAKAVGFESPSAFGCRSFDEYRMRQPEDAPLPPGFVMVSQDPDASWRAIGEIAYQDASSYASWQEPGVSSDTAAPGVRSWQELRASGRYEIVTPDGAMALAERDGSLMLHPLMGGLDPVTAWESLRLFEKEVLSSLGRS